MGSICAGGNKGLPLLAHTASKVACLARWQDNSAIDDTIGSRSGPAQSGWTPAPES